MAVEMNAWYDGNLKMHVIHGPSGVELKTAAPLDNKGDGSSFSPTDLVAAAAATCMVTTMAIVAEREGIAFPTAAVRIEKHMSADPRRVGRLPSRIEMPAGLSAEARQTLEHAAHHCPVNRSLHPDVRSEIEFVYPD
jgi:putative redox protein